MRIKLVLFCVSCVIILFNVLPVVAQTPVSDGETHTRLIEIRDSVNDLRIKSQLQINALTDIKNQNTTAGDKLDNIYTQSLEQNVNLTQLSQDIQYLTTVISGSQSVRYTSIYTSPEGYLQSVVYRSEYTSGDRLVAILLVVLLIKDFLVLVSSAFRGVALR